MPWNAVSLPKVLCGLLELFSAGRCALLPPPSLTFGVSNGDRIRVIEILASSHRKCVWSVLWENRETRERRELPIYLLGRNMSDVTAVETEPERSNTLRGPNLDNEDLPLNTFWNNQVQNCCI